MTRVLIVGGGISGLATAWFLRRRGVPVTVLEAGSEPGGSIRTIERAGYRVDAGPTSTLYRDGALAELVRELGLEADVIQADGRAARYIVKRDRLVTLPTGPVGVLTTSLFSAAAKLRLLSEPFRGRAVAEESIAQFTRRRLGQEFLDWAVDPFVSGVYAGDPERLSVRAAVPRVYALEAEHGSLVRAALARAFSGRAAGTQPPGRLISFARGMQTLPRALATALGPDLHLNAEVSTIRRGGDGAWEVRTANAEFHAPELVLAVPAYSAARLLASLNRPLAQELAAISYAPVVSVALGYARSQVAHSLAGFGALFPRKAQRQTLGVVFSSSLFAGRAPAEHVLLTAFIGGAGNPTVVERAESALVEQVIADLRPLLGISGEPAFRQVSVWRRAIPQYELGHLERLRRVDGALTATPGLSLRANWRDGVSLADSVASAAALAVRFTSVPGPGNPL